ncbi:MAG: hypothetical protein HFJ95_01635 [Muribaculaceae bacterium]|nr:hypothetical protein [Muribaculaceae bacterium]
MSEKVTELSNEMLKSLMVDAAVTRAVITDADLATKAGIYMVDCNALNPAVNLPANQGMLLVFTFGGTVWQIYLANSEKLYFRHNWHATTWRPWKIVTSTTLST